VYKVQLFLLLIFNALQTQVIHTQLCQRARFALSRWLFVVWRLAASCGILRHVAAYKPHNMPRGVAQHHIIPTSFKRGA